MERLSDKTRRMRPVTGRVQRPRPRAERRKSERPARLSPLAARGESQRAVAVRGASKSENDTGSLFPRCFAARKKTPGVVFHAAEFRHGLLAVRTVLRGIDLVPAQPVAADARKRDDAISSHCARQPIRRGDERRFPWMTRCGCIQTPGDDEAVRQEHPATPYFFVPIMTFRSGHLASWRPHRRLQL
jgi:hypothetical protein